jgi:hypothetical protein
MRHGTVYVSLSIPNDVNLYEFAWLRSSTLCCCSVPVLRAKIRFVNAIPNDSARLVEEEELCVGVCGSFTSHQIHQE